MIFCKRNYKWNYVTTLPGNLYPGLWRYRVIHRREGDRKVWQRWEEITCFRQPNTWMPYGKYTKLTPVSYKPASKLEVLLVTGEYI